MKMEIAIRGFMPLTTLYPKAVPAVEKFYTCGFSPEYQIIRITQTQQRVANNKEKTRSYQRTHILHGSLLFMNRNIL